MVRRWMVAVAFAGFMSAGFFAACGGGSQSPIDASVTPDASPENDAIASDVTPDNSLAIPDAGYCDGAAAALALTLPVKSLRDFGAACDGTTDDRDAVAKAFAAAANNTYLIDIDSTCSAYIKVGTDLTQPIFFANGTAVKMEPGAKLIVDNVSIPTFEIVDTNDITLIDWNISYSGSLPADGGGWVSGQYNDNTLRTFLATQRNVTFNDDAGFASANWASPTNMSAMFDIRGSSTNVLLNGLTATGGATGDKFIPMMFSIVAEAQPGSVISAHADLDGGDYVNPSCLIFNNVTLDGTYFGWQGQPTHSIFSHVTSLRYGDMQNASGGEVGGCPGDGGSCLFAPPHLFYINEPAAPALYPHDNLITDVNDEGQRVGVARDPSSGNACSIKFGGENSTMDGYTSHRPDGLMDVLASKGNTIKNVSATFDSTFCGDKYPGVRFPGTPYVDLSIANLSLTDTAASTDHAIFPGQEYPGSVTNANVRVNVTMNQWTGTGSYTGGFAGTTSDALGAYTVIDPAEVTSAGQKNAMTFSLKAAPSSVKAGGSTTLTWSSKNATSCAAAGAWSGSQGANGTATQNQLAAGTQTYSLACTDGTDTGTATVNVTVSP